jgi:hypothetical protein
MEYTDATPQWVDYDAWGHIKFVTENRFALSEANKTAMAQLVTLAEREEMNVYLVSSPLYEGLAGNELFQAYDAELDRTLDSFAASSEYVHHLPVLSVYASDQMQNVDHVVYEGALRYTKEVAQAVLDLDERR